MADEQPRTGLPAILERLAAHLEWHTISGGAHEEDLSALARELGAPIPAEWRAFLTKFGGGLFYGHHEMFGARTVLIHDIELVTDVLTARRQLGPRLGATAATTMVPIHQADGQFHWFDLRELQSPSPRVFGSAGRPPYPDFATFLSQVVVPPSPQ